MIYLDNAATTGRKPPDVMYAVNTALKTLSANPGRSGHSASQRAAMAVYEARQSVSDFFGADGAQNVAFTANCTEALNFVIKGVLSKGDHIIVSDVEHNAVMRPLHASGIEYDCAEISLENDEDTVENFKRLIRPNTKMILCTGASNVIGKKTPVTELGRLCKERELLFAVDAAQTAGVVPINMADANIDYLCVAPHKGLYAPMGVGILIARKPLVRTVIEGGTGTDSANIEQAMIFPECAESGTVNVPAIIGIKAGINFVNKIGIENISRHEGAVTERIYKGLSSMSDISLYTPYPTREGFAPVLSFNIKGKNSGETAELLNSHGIAVRAGLHCAPNAHRKIGTLETGTVRVCPSVFTETRDAERFLTVVKNIKNF